MSPNISRIISELHFDADMDLEESFPPDGCFLRMVDLKGNPVGATRVLTVEVLSPRVVRIEYDLGDLALPKGKIEAVGGES